MKNTKERYNKLKIALRYYLLGAKYYKALKALELGLKYHNGTRKDGETPEFYHQLEIAHYLLTLKDIGADFESKEDIICSALLHDIREDYNLEYTFIEKEFGSTVAQSVELLTKKFNGNKKTPESYFNELSSSKIASIVKGIDRINNLSTMSGVFSKEKQLSYVKEVEDYFLPMLKRARKKYPDCTYLYLNIESYLKNLVKIVRGYIEK